MQTLLVGSRKGLFVVRGQGAQWTVVSHHFAGDPVTQVLADPRTGHWFAALRMGHFGVKLRKSTDQGASWTEIPAPAFPPKPSSGPLADDPTPWNVDQVWALTPGGADQPGTCGRAVCRPGCSSQKTAAPAGRSAPHCGKTRAARAGLGVAMTFRACTRCWWTHAMRSTSRWPSRAAVCGKPKTVVPAGRSRRQA